MTDEAAERLDRIETALRQSFLKLMRIERVGCFDEPTFDEFVEDAWTVIERTNCLSDAFDDLKAEREASRMAAE